MTRITPSGIIPTIHKRIIIPVLQQPLAILRIAVLCSESVVSGKFGAVVRRNERLIEPLPVDTRRRPLGRGEVRVIPVPASIWLLWVSTERILVLRADGVGRAGRVQKLFVVTEDDKKEESGETEFDEEGDNVGPSAPAPGSIAPYARRGG